MLNLVLRELLEVKKSRRFVCMRSSNFFNIFKETVGCTRSDDCEKEKHTSARLISPSACTGPNVFLLTEFSSLTLLMIWTC